MTIKSFVIPAPQDIVLAAQANYPDIPLEQAIQLEIVRRVFGFVREAERILGKGKVSFEVTRKEVTP